MLNGRSIKIFAAKTDALNDEELFSRIYQATSVERRAKVDRLMQRSDKNLSLASEYLLSYAAKTYGLEKFTLCYDINGKPYFADSKLQFSLSHSCERVMCAIGIDEVGCDVERVRKINQDVTQRYFCKEEYEQFLAPEGSSERQELFFRLWTLKESFLKAVGLGMRLPLDSFCINVSGKVPTVRQSVNENLYYFKEYTPDDGYKYAVCSTASQFENLQFVEIQ